MKLTPSDVQSWLQRLTSQASRFDGLDKFRRLRRPLETWSFRKIIAASIIFFVFILYLGPSIFHWFFGRRNHTEHYSASLCVDMELSEHSDSLDTASAHVHYWPSRSHEVKYLPYVGNGHFGISHPSDGHQQLFIAAKGLAKTLDVPTNFRPVVSLTRLRDKMAGDFSGRVVDYERGLIHSAECFDNGGGAEIGRTSVTSKMFAHRKMREIFVQTLKMSNPTAETVRFRLDRSIVSAWNAVTSLSKTLSTKNGKQEYSVLSTSIDLSKTTNLRSNKIIVMTVIVPKLPDDVAVEPGKTHTARLLSSISYSEPLDMVKASRQKNIVEKEAMDALEKAIKMSDTDLMDLHTSVWKSLWKTGFGVSHSMADESVNGLQVNATMYYVLSNVLASSNNIKVARENREDYLDYLEGCYEGHPTMLASNLWTDLDTTNRVNNVVKLWMLTLDKNGCHKLLQDGAGGAMQAMVLSMAGLAFRKHHLELNSNPKDMHRDVHVRGLEYGDHAHLNISVVVDADNKAGIVVALDNRGVDYYACDAGCLDPPVKLGIEPRKFPVKLTNPVTAVLYITADYAHMNELKHTIHVKEVADAPAHEHHVIALHKHGNKLGGLPAIFWFSIGFLIFVFHLFLFKLIWQECCASAEKYRSSKFV